VQIDILFIISFDKSGWSQWIVPVSSCQDPRLKQDSGVGAMLSQVGPYKANRGIQLLT